MQVLAYFEELKSLQNHLGLEIYSSSWPWLEI